MTWVWFGHHSRVFTHCFPIWTFPLQSDRAACFPQTCPVQFSHPGSAFLLCPVHFNHLYQDHISSSEARLKSYFLSTISSCISTVGNNLSLNWMRRPLRNITQKAPPFSCLCCGRVFGCFPPELIIRLRSARRVHSHLGVILKASTTEPDMQQILSL